MLENGVGASNEGNIVSGDDINLLEYQVGGHGIAGSGLQKHKNGFILKPNQDRGRGIREIQFYQEIYNNNNDDNGKDEDEVRLLFQQLTPKFLGTCSVNVITESGEIQCQEFIQLEDVVKTYAKPCIIDIKVGAQTWNPTHSIEKIKKESAKYTGTRVPLGISVAGMYYYDMDLKKYVREEKDYGKKLIPSTLYEGLQRFLNFKSGKSNHVITQILERLKTVEKLFLLQSKYAFYASSLLIVYDAAILEEDKQMLPGKVDNSIQNHASVYMIDFAHVFPLEKSQDDNYLFGLRSVIQLFTALSARKTEFTRELDIFTR